MNKNCYKVNKINELYKKRDKISSATIGTTK
jgi:hypothetical protein